MTLGFHPRLVFLLLILVAAWSGPALGAEIPLVGGRVAKFKTKPEPKANKGSVKFAKDPAIDPTLHPVDCPSDVPWLRLRASGDYDSGRIFLPCENWTETSKGFKYKDKDALAGGVQTLIYGSQKLVLKLKGVNYTPIVGLLPEPAFVEVEFSPGGEDEYCGRFDTKRLNATDLVIMSRDTVACVPPPIECPVGFDCAAFDIEPGSGDLLPVDDGASTWLRVFDFTGASLFGNATNGEFGPSPLAFAKGPEDPSGIADLEFIGPAHVGANFLDLAQGLGATGTICVEIAQDPGATGWIDCDGGTDASVSLAVDSNGAGPIGTPVLTAGATPDAGAPAGEAVVRVQLRFLVTPENDADCAAQDYSGSPVIPSAFTTGVADSTVTNDWIDGAPGVAPNTVSLAGVGFAACGDWGAVPGTSWSLVAPLFATDFLAPVLEQVVDVSQVFRLDLTPVELPTGGPTPTPTPQPTATRTPTPTPGPSGTPGALGTLSFTVAEGQGGFCPSDGSAGSFLKTRGNPTGGFAGTVCSGTQGNFSSGPLELVGGMPDGDGIASLSFGAAVVIGANLDGQTPNCGGSCVACWRFEDDTSRAGFVDCDGGSNADATLVVDSNNTAAPPSPSFDSAWFSAPSGGGDDGAGAAVLPVLVKRLRLNGTSTCPAAGASAWDSVSAIPVSLVTGTAQSTINDRRQCPGSVFGGTGCPSSNPYQVALSGSSLNCGNWSTGSGGALVMPLVNLDENIGGSFGTGDIAQVLRLND